MAEVLDLLNDENGGIREEKKDNDDFGDEEFWVK